jgi:hypothetical protein
VLKANGVTETRPGPRSLPNRDQGSPSVDADGFLHTPTAAGRETGDLRSGHALPRVESENDASSRREDSSEQAHQWVPVGSMPNAQFLTFGEIKLQLRTSHPINRELKFVAPRSGSNGHRLGVFDPCNGLAVDQDSIRPSRIEPSLGGSLDRDLSACHRRIVGVAFRVGCWLIEARQSRCSTS